MSSNCCSSGKARIYYNIPTKGGLKYKLKNSTQWKSIFAEESLTSTCLEIPGAFTGGQCDNKSYRVFINHNQSYQPNPVYPAIIKNYDYYFDTNGRVDFIKFLSIEKTGINSISVSRGFGNVFIHAYAIRNQDGQEFTTGFSALIIRDYTTNIYSVTGIIRLDGTSKADDIDQCGGNNPTKKFTVTGTETGTKYLEIEVDECPAVQNIPCKFDPAKEQYIDVEMSTSPNVESCIDVVEADPNPITGGLGVHIILIKIVRDHKGGPRPPIWSSRGYFYSPKGCPAPKVRVECCTTPDCQNNKKCPKGTTCEIVCNGFKCCYRNGKLIRSIKL
jgi:hypothetical protein